MRRVRLWVHAGALVATMAVVACGGSDAGGPNPGPGTPNAMEAAGGDQQMVQVGQAVPVKPAVRVKDADGAGVPGVTVHFAVTSGGGSVTGASATTNGQGVATVGGWTLGTNAGVNTLTASVQGGQLTPVTFTATGVLTAPARKWTVMVFMAADNNLAVQGILDIDEMEAAGVTPEVQVVVQAEFNPATLAQYNCGPNCFNRPNFNTFRYAVAGQGATVTGPNGPAIDIGNRDMTDPDELRDFILWAKQNYPAEHYALVLWNHGGGYVGLLQDETSAGGGLMSVGDLPAAFQGVGPIDLIDFDMCLMAGYETLVKLAGHVDYAVFSEEVVPGEGNPYKEIIDALQATPGMSLAEAAAMLVNTFHASYAGNRASTTISAYALNGLAGLETALGTLAGSLRNDLTSLRPAIAAALGQTQKYTYRELTDLVDLLDHLKLGTTDAALHDQIDAVRAAAMGGFRLASAARTGTATDANDVSGSHGLHIVLPSGANGDQLGATGPRSLAAYQALYPGAAWTQFLTDWLNGQSTTAQTDQGNNRFEGYLVWSPQAVGAGADVDLWVLEPNGNLYIPYLGSVTPNGTLSNDSDADGTSFEAYITNRFVENGTYKFYANLYRDPQDFEPLYDLVYRTDPNGGFSSLYEPDYPRLSTQVSWLNDPTPTLGEVEAGAYTDLQYVAVLTFGPSGAPSLARKPAGAAGAASAGAMITPAQLRAVRQALSHRAPSDRHAGLRPRGLQAALPMPGRAAP